MAALIDHFSRLTVLANTGELATCMTFRTMAGSEARTSSSSGIVVFGSLTRRMMRLMMVGKVGKVSVSSSRWRTRSAKAAPSSSPGPGSRLDSPSAITSARDPSPWLRATSQAPTKTLSPGVQDFRCSMATWPGKTRKSGTRPRSPKTGIVVRVLTG